MTLSLDTKQLEYLKNLLIGRAYDLDNMIRSCSNTSNKEHLETNLDILGKVKYELEKNKPVTISREDVKQIVIFLKAAPTHGNDAFNEKERLIKLLRNEND